MRWGLALLEDQNAALREEQQRLEAERERLRAEVDALRRAAKRQAAPFSKGDPTPTPKRPGRKPGVAYGTRAHRHPPEHADRVITVGLPACCPGCGGELALERVAVQYQEDLPSARPLVTCYQLHVGRCQSCGRRVQPHHPGQTADALGAAGTQIGPRAVALASWLSKMLGVPAGKIARLFAQLGLHITPGGVVQAVARAGRACQPTYQVLTDGVRASPVVAPDETGWRVGGIRAWLWTFVGDQVTVYRIARGRGYLDAAAVLGEDYAGVLERDGWAPYRRFVHPRHQTCLAHLLRRCRELISDAVAGQAKTPHAVRRVLTHALALRDAHNAGALDTATLAISPSWAPAACRPPTGAEQVIRPAVVSRKTWGGNRTWAGADTWQALTGVLRTASQQNSDPIELLARRRQAPVPIVADLAIPGHRSAPDAVHAPTR